jgi:hypothetical protein
MTSFSDFWNLLEKENPIWWEQVNMRFYKKDVKKCAQDCHVYILADQKLFKQLTEMDGAALRKYFTSWLMKAPDAPQAPILQQLEEPKEVETDPAKLPIPKSDPRYQKYLELWQQEIDKFAVDHTVPKVTKEQAKEEGQWEKPKPAVYKSDEEDFLYHLRQNIKRFAARKYKGYYKWDGFKHFQIGLVTVYAANIKDATDILEKAERYTKTKAKQ